MNAPFAEMRRLHNRGPNARGLIVDADGVMLGPDCVLVARSKTGYRRIDAAVLDRLVKNTFGAGHRLERFSIVLDRITAALAAGDVVKVQLLGLEIPLSALDGAQLIRLQTASSLIKAGFDPDQARDERGRWAAEGSGETDAGGSSVEADRGQSDGGGIVPAADKIGHTPAGKERFVEAHLADARKIAEQLHVPVENILALSALESNWGDHRFAAKGNNFFGIHFPAAGSMQALDDPNVEVATFPSYAESGRSFVRTAGDFVKGKADPREFATALQNSGKFGINQDGSKVPTYVDGVAGTIRGIRSIVARRQI
jgi:mannosyl-glycoprotein endo-beta-N-acetylglucosaminidase